MTTADRNIVSVTFGVHLGGYFQDQIVAMSEIAKFADENRGLVVKQVNYDDGDYSYAKGFRLKSGAMDYIGLSAYGDGSVVWERLFIYLYQNTPLAKGGVF